jgi:diguanylate cyclase (GGDEF)-like protein/PAS domain S-box-containing protein
LQEKNNSPIPFNQIVTHANDIIIVTEAGPLDLPGPRIVYVNEAFSRLTGYSSNDAIGKTPRLLQGRQTDQATKARIKAALAAQKPIRERILNYDKKGNPYWLDINLVPLRNSDGEVTHFVAIERDITENVVNEQKLKKESLTDSLTGLNNRRGFNEYCSLAIDVACKQGRDSVIAEIDIDHFKNVNDSLGHDAGDEALAHLAGTLQGAFRSGDIIGRLGGEEFAVLIIGAGIETCIAKMEKLREKVASTPIQLTRGSELSITISIGISPTAESCGSNLDAMLKLADTALYKAKESGRNRVILFEGEN